MKLNESSWQENIDCPFCGWEGGEHHQDRSGVGEKVKGFEDVEYTVHEWCDLCGWNAYAINEEYYEEVVQNVYDQWGEEDAEEHIPDQEIEYEPSSQNVTTAKKIIPIIDRIYVEFEDNENVSEAIAEFIWDWHPEEKDKRTVKDFYYGLVDWMFDRSWA